MITRKTIYGFILALCCLYFHQEYASPGDENNIQVLGLVAAGTFTIAHGLNHITSAYYKENSTPLFLSGSALFMLGLAGILFSKQIVSGVDTICSKSSKEAEALEGLIQKNKNKKSSKNSKKAENLEEHIQETKEQKREIYSANEKETPDSCSNFFIE